MPVNSMRAKIAQEYGWRIQGKHLRDIPDAQVIAIYNSIISRKAAKVNKQKGQTKMSGLSKSSSHDEYLKAVCMDEALINYI